MLPGEEKARGWVYDPLISVLMVEGERDKLQLVWKVPEGDTPGDSVLLARTETRAGWLLHRQLICLAVFSFPVWRTNIHRGENTD